MTSPKLPVTSSFGGPRRNDITANTPAELHIRDCITEIEELGVDPRLTQAVTLLTQARNAVADWLEDAS